MVLCKIALRRPKKRPEGPSGSHAAAQRPSEAIGMLPYHIYIAISLALVKLSPGGELHPPYKKC